jgi:hypothetical protein
LKAYARQAGTKDLKSFGHCGLAAEIAFRNFAGFGYSKQNKIEEVTIIPYFII